MRRRHPDRWRRTVRLRSRASVCRILRRPIRCSMQPDGGAARTAHECTMASGWRSSCSPSAAAIKRSNSSCRPISPRAEFGWRFAWWSSGRSSRGRVRRRKHSTCCSRESPAISRLHISPRCTTAGSARRCPRLRGLPFAAARLVVRPRAGSARLVMQPKFSRGMACRKNSRAQCQRGVALPFAWAAGNRAADAERSHGSARRTRVAHAVDRDERETAGVALSVLLLDRRPSRRAPRGVARRASDARPARAFSRRRSRRGDEPHAGGAAEGEGLAFARGRPL